MAYNSNKGPQHSGDIQFEGDPNDVQIDFENDQVSLKAGGINRLTATSGSVLISGSLSGSGVISMVGSISSSADIAVSGAIHATTFHGSAAGLTSLPSPSNLSGTTAQLTTGVETSGYLKVSGSSTLNAVSGTTAQFTTLTASQIVGGSPLSISASSITFSGSVEFSGSSVLSASSATLTSLTASAISGGSPIEIFGDTVTIVGDGGIALRGRVSGSNILHNVGAVTLGSTLSTTGSMTAGGGVFSNTYSGSGVMEVVGASVFGNNVRISGSTAVVGLVSSSNSIVAVGSITSSANMAASGSVIIGDGRFLGISSRETMIQLNDGNVILDGLLKASNVSASGQSAIMGATILGSTLGVSGSTTLKAGLSSSAGAEYVGNVILGSQLKVTGSLLSESPITASRGINISNNNASASFGPKALEIYWNGTNGVMESEVGHLNIRVNQAAKDIRLRMGDAAGSSQVEFRTNADANVATVDSNGKISGSSDLEVVGNTMIGGTLAVSGSTTLKSALSSSSTLQIVGTTVLGNNLNVSGSTVMEGLTANVIANVGLYSGSSIINSVGSISSSANLAVSGNVHAAVFHGSAAGLTSLPSPTSISGTTAQLTTGVETSGFLKVSGSAITGPFRSEGKIERTVHAYIFGANTAHFIPQFGTTSESTSGDYRHQFIAPFNGNLRRVLARAKNNVNGNCTAKVAVASDGTEDFNAAGASAEVEAQTISITAANTTGTFNFSGSQHFTAGQIVGVQMTFNQNPADVNITCIWEYDDRSV